jgi:hypothetical protein
VGREGLWLFEIEFSLDSLSWTGTQDPPTTVSPVLGLQACATNLPLSAMLMYLGDSIHNKFSTAYKINYLHRSISSTT